MFNLFIAFKLYIKQTIVVKSQESDKNLKVIFIFNAKILSVLEYLLYIKFCL
jgi:hypothetical protein